MYNKLARRYAFGRGEPSEFSPRENSSLMSAYAIGPPAFTSLVPGKSTLLCSCQKRVVRYARRVHFATLVPREHFRYGTIIRREHFTTLVQNTKHFVLLIPSYNISITFTEFKS